MCTHKVRYLAFLQIWVMITKSMIRFQSHIQIQRGGEEYRSHRHRYFYIKHCGWFVRTRGDLEISEGVELFDGIVGPFATRAKAKFHLLKLIYQEHPELFTQQPVEQ
jgi:hypothetical protein